MLKVDPTGSDIGGLLAGEPVARCVRASYRTALVAPGDPVLLWVSGRDATWSAGVHGSGRVLAAVDDPGPGPGQPSVRVALRPVDPPVLRADLLAHPVLAGLEVLRMAAGSNPSHVTREQLDALRHGWPQVGRAS